MPGQDKTGPMGQGPMTGRGMGPCGRGMQMGSQRGFGRGMGLCRGFGLRQNFTKTEEKEILTEDLEDLKKEVKAIEERLKDLQKD